MEPKSLRGLLLAVAVMLSVALAGCGTSGGGRRTLTAITISPSMPALNVGNTVNFVATGHYRGGSTQTLTGVVWSSSDPTAVSIDASGSATALKTGASAATITATLGSLSGSTQVNVKPPVVIDVTPALPVVTIGGNQAFHATGKFADLTSVDLTNFVTWSSSSGSVATIGNDGVATGVGRGIATITATNSGVGGSAWFDVTDKTFSNASLSGSYAFTLTGFDGSRPVFECGSIVADGNGIVTGGIEDINASTPANGVALTGSYAITPDGRGTMTLSGDDGQTRAFNVILKANSPAPGDTNAQIIQNDQQANAIGRLEKQDSTAFNNAALGDSKYVFRVGGITTAGNRSAIGQFSTDSSGANFNGWQDVNDAGTVAYAPVSGTIDSVHPTWGRATATLGGSNFAVYVVSPNRVNLIQIDAGRPAVMGIAERQTATVAPLSGGYAFDVEIGGTQGISWLIGQFDFDGMDVLGGSQIQDGYVSITVNPLVDGFCITDEDGRGYLIEDTDHGIRNFVVYIVSPDKMYMMVANDDHAASGTAELQQLGEGESFSVASLNGDFAFGAAETGEGQLTFVGQAVFDGAGNFYAVDDLSEPGFVGTAPLLGGTYTVSANGETIITLPLGAKVPSFTMYLISPSKGLFLGTPEPDVNGVAELQ